MFFYLNNSNKCLFVVTKSYASAFIHIVERFMFGFITINHRWSQKPAQAARIYTALKLQKTVAHANEISVVL